ncbi:hypothetical protein N7486_002454 [Penicillium sp. IBT 16267x]|nr:hypothetical protein N7486_002454 [Penicillium sp. IBT 16267x]
MQQILCPIPSTPIFVCIGLNYKQHAQEANMAYGEYPVVFTKPADALAGPFEDVPINPACLNMDYEAELCVILGKDCKNLTADADFPSYILGYTAGNDVSSRWWQMPERSSHQHGGAKSFDKFAPIGPVITSTSVMPDQEQLHALDAITALKHFNQTPVAPCLYDFPVSTFEEAISLAQTFTSVVLGTLQNVVVNMGAVGDFPLTQDITSVIGQEGEQEGWFRLLGGNIPSELPFLTNLVRDFAFNALNQSFIVPGSCPNLDTTAALKSLHFMEPLTVVNTFDPRKSTAKVVDLSFSLPSAADSSDYTVAYINQQNVPFFLPYNVTGQHGDLLSVRAPFPYTDHELNGLTILAIVPTSSVANLTSNQAVATATLAGTGLVIIN